MTSLGLELISSLLLINDDAGGVPWKEHLFELEAENKLSGESSILYVIYTDQNGMWRIQCVPVRPNSFENRLGLPEVSVGSNNLLT